MAVSLFDRLLQRIGLVRRDALAFQDWVNYFTYGGVGYLSGLGQLGGLGSQTLGGKQEMPNTSFEGFVQRIYKTNGVVFAVQAVRLMLFSEARFQFRRMIDGRPGELFGTKELRILEHPWTNAVTGDLLMRAIQDADLGGNHYGVRRGEKIRRLRPDWVTIVAGSDAEPDDPSGAIDAEVIGYIHQPSGRPSRKPDILLPEEVAHFAPIPDPIARFRGMSWLQPVIAEIMGDSAATEHKLKFFENGATPNLVVALDKQTSMDEKTFEAFLTKMKEQHEGTTNAYRTLYLANGATATPVGANLRQIDFKDTQGAGETRIAAAGGVPPVIVGLSEGLAAATYSNYGQARRRLADGTLRPLWRNCVGSYGHLVTVPNGAELWYDDRDIPFLQEDRKDAADIRQVEATTIEGLIRAGYLPDSVIDAVTSGDFARLKGKHSGLYSIQLQSPGSPKLPDRVPGETPATPIAAPAPQPALPAGPAKKSRDIEPAAEPDLLKRELEVAGLIGEGLTNKEIAQRIDASERTVERAIQSALRKLRVTTRTELAVAVARRSTGGKPPIVVAALGGDGGYSATGAAEHSEPA